jgi:hypothetical protein
MCLKLFYQERSLNDHLKTCGETEQNFVFTPPQQVAQKAAKQKLVCVACGDEFATEKTFN